jgi:hypothetical protein
VELVDFPMDIIFKIFELLKNEEADCTAACFGLATKSFYQVLKTFYPNPIMLHHADGLQVTPQQLDQLLPYVPYGTTWDVATNPNLNDYLVQDKFFPSKYQQLVFLPGAAYRNTSFT